MRNRNYFRIEELSDVTKVTLGDLKYAVENEGLCLYACGKVQVGKDLFGAFRRTAKKPIGSFGDFFEAVNTDDRQAVYIEQVVIEPQNLRFKLDMLTEHFGLDVGLANGLETEHSRLPNRFKSGLLTEDKQLPNLKGSEERIITNPIEQIMVRILKDKGKNLSSDQVWRCLRVDVKNEDERIYDNDFVIECMDQNEIVRRSLDGESTVSTGRRRFRNLLVEVKKNFKLY